MAVKPPDTTKPEAVLNPATPLGVRGAKLNGLRLERYPYITQNVDDTDTWTPGGGPIAFAWWEAAADGDHCAVTWTADTVTFNTAAANKNGYLILARSA